MPENIERVVQRDLDQLPLLPPDRWIPRPTGRSAPGWFARLAFLPLAMLIMVLAVAAGLQLGEWRAQRAQPVDDSQAAAGGVPSQSSGALAVDVPKCPRGQLPALNVSHSLPPGDLPGTGAANAEAAFRKAYPTITEFTMYPFGTDLPTRDPAQLGQGSVWITAGGETFIALYIGGPGQNSWFAHPAKFLGCRGPSTPVTTSVTRDQAIALVTSLSDVLRADRIEAKLVPWSEFELVGMGVDMTGGPLHGGGIPDAVWAVAVAGDIYPEHTGAPLGTPKRHYTWALWGVNAARLQISTLKVGDSGSWPPGFEPLRDHPAVSPPAPTPTPAPVPFDLIVPAPQRIGQIRDLAAADATHLWAIVSAPGQMSQLMRSDDGGTSWRNVAHPGHGSGAAHVAALGSTVLVSDLGIDTANAGSSTTGGLYVSQDGGGSWKQVSTESVGRLLVVSYRGGPLFVAEHPWVTKGAATGPSQIFTSPDGLTWLRAGEVPGPAVFGMLDVPLVSFGKNIPGDGIYRLVDGDRAPHLEPIPGSPQTQGILQGPRGELWFFEPGNVVNPRLSTDGGRTTRVAAAGLAGRIAGLFVANGKVYAVGDGAYEWDGAQWRVANILTGKASAVFQTTERVFIQDLSGGFWRSR